MRDSILAPVVWTLVFGAFAANSSPAAQTTEVTASSHAEGFEPSGALDGDRFSAEGEKAWRGSADGSTWWWQVRFAEPRDVGAILQINGDHAPRLRNAPREYVWQASLDGRKWRDLTKTRVTREERMYRIHRLERAERVRYLRLKIDKATGDSPVLREAEFYSEPSATIEFPDWIITVNTYEKPTIDDGPDQFTRLARQCKGWEQVPVQQMWMGAFDEDFASAEPQPLCAFLSGNFNDWCQKTRLDWRGIQDVLIARNLPIWASCGGAQGLAILSEFGVDHEWDCPHCRDPQNPKLPIYTHIGHTATKPCGDYSGCLHEKGKHNVKQVARDPAFAGLPREFSIIESHCGQIAYVPKGWVHVIAAGEGSKTEMQCLRLADRYVYAAQFHIEMEGTPENSRLIMANFLRLAKEWGGHNAEGKAVALPAKIEALDE